MYKRQIINRVEQDALFMEYMSGEKQVIMTGTVAGVEVKIKVDSLHKMCIRDRDNMGTICALSYCHLPCLTS